MMFLIQINKDQYINALNIDALNMRNIDIASGNHKVSVSVSQYWFDVHPDYLDSFLNNLRVYNENVCSNTTMIIR